MTYDQVLTLDTIVKYGSFKSAAEVLFKSQPSISMAIKKLEEEFGFLLFDRSEYRPRLTKKGETFYQTAKLLLDAYQSLEKTGKELGAGIETEINICVEAIFPIASISNLLQNFFQPHITTSLNLNTDVLEGVIEKIKNHEVDFAIAPDFEAENDFERIQFMQTDIVPVIAAEHSEYSVKLLKNLPQIVIQSSASSRNNNVHGAYSKKFWYTSDLFMKEQLISSGLGWGRLPIHQVQNKINNGSLVVIEGMKGIAPLPVPIYLLRAKDKIMGPITRKLWDYLAQMNREAE